VGKWFYLDSPHGLSILNTDANSPCPWSLHTLEQQVPPRILACVSLGSALSQSYHSSHSSPCPAPTSSHSTDTKAVVSARRAGIGLACSATTILGIAQVAGTAIGLAADVCACVVGEGAGAGSRAAGIRDGVAIVGGGYTCWGWGCCCCGGGGGLKRVSDSLSIQK
jgi:hypothetical protein